jgi:hypothetical protein
MAASCISLRASMFKLASMSAVEYLFSGIIDRLESDKGTITVGSLQFVQLTVGNLQSAVPS